MSWTLHRNMSEFGGPGEDGQALGLALQVLGHSATCRWANAHGPLYFAACPAWVNGGKLLKNPDGTQVFPNVHTPKALADLQPGAKVTFRYHGNTATGVFLDVGPASWTNRYLDLGYNLTRALGFSGTGDVEWTLDAGGGSVGAGAAMVAFARKFLGTNGYSEGPGHRFGEGVTRDDCSSYVNAAVHHATGRYIGTSDSWTGSQMDWLKANHLWVGGSNAWKHGDPGDCVYYSGHVAMLEVGGKVISNGSDPIKEHAADYRTVLGIGRTSTLAPKAAPKPTPKPVPPIPVVLNAVYRLYNSKEHFYTVDHTEAVAAQKLGYAYEGVAWTSDPARNELPAVRFLRDGIHFWTSDAAEIAALDANPKWKREEMAFNVSATGTPIFRFLTKGGGHFWTVNEAEGAAAGFTLEGVAFHVN